MSWKFWGFIGTSWALFASLLYAEEGLCVMQHNAQLRAGPGLEYAMSSWPLPRYTPLQKIATWGNWYQVQDFEGDSHWIHSTEVILGESCLIVLRQTAFYAGPGEAYPHLGWSKPRQVFRFSRQIKSWVQAVSEQGKVVWMQAHAVWINTQPLNTKLPHRVAVSEE